MAFQVVSQEGELEYSLDTTGDSIGQPVSGVRAVPVDTQPEAGPSHIRIASPSPARSTTSSNTREILHHLGWDTPSAPAISTPQPAEQQLALLPPGGLDALAPERQLALATSIDDESFTGAPDQRVQVLNQAMVTFNGAPPELLLQAGAEVAAAQHATAAVIQEGQHVVAEIVENAGQAIAQER